MDLYWASSQSQYEKILQAHGANTRKYWLVEVIENDCIVTRVGVYDELVPEPSEIPRAQTIFHCIPVLLSQYRNSENRVEKRASADNSLPNSQVYNPCGLPLYVALPNEILHNWFSLTLPTSAISTGYPNTNTKLVLPSWYM